MKKTILFLTGLLILVTGAVFAVTGQEAAAPIVLENTETEIAAEEAEISRLVYDYDSLAVAGATPTTGNFFCSLWGNVTSDMDVRMLLHGYNLVEWETEEGMFVVDPTVVSGLIVTENQIGDRTYTIALYNDLYYSDGSRITARDYIFSLLLTMSNEAAEIGGNVKRPEYLLGYNDYISGAVPYLRGVRLLAEDQFSITVSADYLPFFYELGLLDCTPYPVSEIAPGVTVNDNGSGVFLTGDFTAEVLRRTILDPQTGYLTHPRITSGPYTLTSYNNGVAEFELNPYYKGDAHGMLPHIRKLTYRSATADEMVNGLADGSLQLLNKVTSTEAVQNALQTVGANPQLTMANYLRTGLAFISMNNDSPVVNDVSVRQAIAYQMDKDSFVMETVGSNGLRADGYYGLGQWMYQLLSGALAFPVEDDDPEYDEKMAEWEELTMDNINTYEQNTDQAIALLAGAGWTLNGTGGTFSQGTDTLRYKEINGQLTPLRVTLAYPENATAMGSLRNLAAALRAIGMELEISEMPLDGLLAQFYGSAAREYDMYFLASNFDALFDPSAGFVTDEAGQHVWAATGLADEDLYQYAVNMRKTEAGDLIAYCTEWLKFQERFAEILPMIPLYSNVYFDFFPQELHDYDISSYLSWSQAVIPAYMSDVVEEEELAEEEGDFEIIR